ncbi:MAG: hypothetical protein H7175_11360, partial [Burkholderiales bacterium]|nr:hypothetical protein [Anaerolineae bacterium]
GVGLWRLLRGQGSALERAAYGLALLSPLMVIPSVISVGGLPPNHMRSIGMTPLLFVLVAVGAEWVLAKIHLSPDPSPQAERGVKRLVIVVVAALAIGGGLVARDYFVWASRADLYYETDADLAAAARWLPSQVDDNTRVYITTRYREHPTIEAARLPFPVTMLGVDTLLIVPPDEDGLYIFPRSAPPADEWRVWLEVGAIDGLPLGPDGGASSAFEAFRRAGDMSLPVPDVPPQVTADNGLLTLVGLDVPTVESGGRGQIVMAWQVQQTPTVSDLTPIVQIEDELGTVLYRAEPYMTGTDDWLPGERLLQRIPFRIPIGTPPSLYTLRVAWVERDSDHYVPFAAGGIWASIAPLEVVRAEAYPDPSELDITVRETHDVAAGVRLLGWNPASTRVRPGEALLLTLFWQGVLTDDERATVDYQARLGDSPLWGGAPGYGENPSGGWIDGQLMTDHVRWPIPREMDAGPYSLTLEVGDSIINLGTVEVEGLPRLFEQPPIEQTLDVRFGDVLQLTGYNLQNEGDALTLDLVWRADGTVAQDYKVFVHVVDENGEIIAQQDTMPQHDTYPTSLWAEGEYVPDQYTFTNLPLGRYRVRVGLYLPADGSRLPMSENGEIVGDSLEINLVES